VLGCYLLYVRLSENSRSAQAPLVSEASHEQR
jgi:hypothetical protein